MDIKCCRAVTRMDSNSSTNKVYKPGLQKKKKKKKAIQPMSLQSSNPISPRSKTNPN